MNQLVSNIKKKPTLRNTSQWPYKERAICDAGDAFRRSLSQQAFDTITFVPIPPSKCRTDPLYDDRMRRVLDRMATHGPLDIRELVVQEQSLAAFHEGVRLSPQQLAGYYSIAEQLVLPAPRSIVVVDDVLTSGCHFKAMQTVLRARFPMASIGGLFIARRVFPDPADAFSDIATT